MSKDYIKPDSAKNNNTEVNNSIAVSNKKNALIFIVIFATIIYSVGLVQAYIEKKEEDRIQFFDLVRDTFVTPVKRAKSISENFNELTMQVDTIVQSLRKIQSDSAENPQYGDLDLVVEEALYLTKDVKNNLVEVNRHIEEDTSLHKIRAINQTRNLIDSLFNTITDNRDFQHVKALSDTIQYLTQKQKKLFDSPDMIDYPVLWCKAFFRYTVFNQKYLRGYEDEIEEKSVAASQVRPIMQFFRYWIMKDAGERGIEGKSDWLFYKPGYQYLVKPKITDPRSIKVDPNDQPLTANPIKTIKKFQEELKEYDVELLIVIVPGKASVYPDRLDPDFPVDSVCKFGNTISVMNKLRKRGVEVVDLLTPFRNSRKKSTKAEETIYLTNDTHWKHAALETAADEVAQRIKSYPWFEKGKAEYVTAPVEVERAGDIAAMTNLPDFNIRSLNLHFDHETVTAHKVFRIVRSEDESFQSDFDFHSIPDALREKLTDKSSIKSIRPYKDKYNKDILLLGDSFSRIYQTDKPRSAGWISHLAKKIGYPIASIVNDGGASTLVRETLARNKGLLKGKKLVIWEFVERDLRYGTKGWKDIDL